jgi:hypothetical protein
MQSMQFYQAWIKLNFIIKLEEGPQILILYLSILLHWGTTYSLLNVLSIMQQSMILIHTLLHNTVVVMCIRCY